MSFEHLMCYDVLEGALLPRLKFLDRARLACSSRALWSRLAGLNALSLVDTVAAANPPQGSLQRKVAMLTHTMMLEKLDDPAALAEEFAARGEEMPPLAQLRLIAEVMKLAAMQQ